MTEASRRIDEALLDLAWSLWGELGVAGTVRHHDDCAVDPEALLVFTPTLAALDPRLRDESLDAALMLAPHLSMTRLKALVARVDEPTRGDFARYAATFNAHSKSGVRFPLTVDASPWGARPSAKSHLSEFAAPSQIALRARALFGVGARADVLATMAAASQSGWLASELAERTGLAKRVVASALQDLERGGVLKSTPIANRLRYELTHREHALSFVGTVPRRFPAWNVILPACASVRRLVAGESQRSGVGLLVDAQRIATGLIGALSRFGTRVDEPTFEAWSETSDWLVASVEGLAAGDSPMLGEARET